MNIQELAKALQEDVVKWRRDLHRIPEVGMDLPETSKYIAERLEEMRIPYKKNVGGSGIVGLIEGSQNGRTIALRADMDALPIVEETRLSFASINGNMHACGHDAHAAILLGAAKVLNDNKESLKGNIKLIFQPAEEGPGGAKPMLDEGVFENPKVEGVLGLHIGGLTEGSRDGEVLVSYGSMMACLDRFKMTIKGKGCHGAYPENGIDPISIAAQVISNVQTIISREISPTDPGVVTFGMINGGFQYNIIPDTVVVEGTVRAVDQKVREFLAKRLEEISKNVVEGMRGSIDIEYTFGYPPLVNHPEITKQFVESAKKIVDGKDIIEMKKPVMGGEDMAYFINEVPGTFFFLSSHLPIDGVLYPHHNSKFALNEAIFEKGVALMVQAATDWLDK
ncbi:M20 metallopeptidase family protein [Acidaminobacter hydrogenoformans]|uniref:Amidohydrolase n=1 Tax=Acidaminobacter hydrogenoformans DSM 2784 TaxID=1120920 RepID=A0A1G5RWU2_9FIRM|nr:M20 family metallopeptidase [Acidaminobacter hydrogenoformans]SCZ78574.1 amidohydrolase [Acidaminobacter hydrogenoformans DSM 2784]